MTTTEDENNGVDIYQGEDPPLQTHQALAATLADLRMRTEQAIALLQRFVINPPSKSEQSVVVLSKLLDILTGSPPAGDYLPPGGREYKHRPKLPVLPHQRLSIENYDTLHKLNTTERNLLQWLADGWTPYEIAEMTRSGHDALSEVLDGLRRKLRATTREALVASAIREGVIT